jgi:hypothetical protein
MIDSLLPKERYDGWEREDYQVSTAVWYHNDADREMLASSLKKQDFAKRLQL